MIEGGVPTWTEFMAGFGWKEIIIALIIAATIFAVRERERISRRKSHDAEDRKNP